MMSGAWCQEMWLLASTLGSVNSVGALNIGLSCRRREDSTGWQVQDREGRRARSPDESEGEGEVGRMIAARKWCKKPVKVTSIVGATFLAFWVVVI